MTYLMLTVSMLGVVVGTLIMKEPSSELALASAAVFALMAIAWAIHDHD